MEIFRTRWFEKDLQKDFLNNFNYQYKGKNYICRMKKKLNRVVMVLIIIAANIGLDQWTKVWARETLQFQPTRSYFGEFFKLLYVENTGAFLSLGADLPDIFRTILLLVFPSVLLVGITFYTMFSNGINKWQVIGMSFIIGGGLSNVYDRILYNGVTDFMNMGLFGIRTGVFNFADVSIMVGLAFMLPFAFRKTPEEQAVVQKEES